MKEKLNINLFKLPEHKFRQGQLHLDCDKGSHPAVLAHKLIEVSRCRKRTVHPGKIISVKIADWFPSDFVKVTADNTFIMPMRMAVSPTGKK